MTRSWQAEIARLTADFNDCNSERYRWKARAENAEAEIARLTYERDVWKSKAEYYGRSKERVALTAEIARLREWKTAAENLIAAIRLDSGIAYPWPALDLADEALKPDTGECEHCKDYVGKCPYCHRPRPKPETVTINAKVGFMSPEYQAALKPDTGEKP